MLHNRCSTKMLSDDVEEDVSAAEAAHANYAGSRKPWIYFRSRKNSHCLAVARSSSLRSSSLSSLKPSSRSLLSLLSSAGPPLLFLSNSSLREVSVSNPIISSPSSSSNKLPSLSPLEYRRSTGHLLRLHDEGSRKLIKASEIRSRSEEVWVDMLVRGRYWEYR